MHEMHDQGEQQGEHEHDVEEEINVLVTSVDAFDALATAVANKCKAMTAAGEYNDNDNDNGDFAGGSNVHAGQVYTLHGSLGVGKSTFARAFIRAFTGMPDLMVTSPTFTIDITYEHNNSSLHHMDLYRIHSEDELDILELGHVFTHDISLIEWPDRLGSCYPEDVIEIFIDDDIPEIVENDEARMVSIVPRGKWRDTYTTVNTGSSSPTEGRDTPTDAMDEVLLLIDNHPDIEYVD